MFARLRGVKENQIRDLVQIMMRAVSVQDHAKKQTADLRYEKEREKERNLFSDKQHDLVAGQTT